MADLHDLTALEQGAALRRGEFTAVELTEHYLQRCEALSDTVGAFVTLTPDLALEQAREADERLKGAGPAEALPPLLGVCVPVKDLTPVADVRMTMGSRVFADFVPKLSAHVVAKLRAAGTVMTGKTNTPEFGLPCYTEPDVAPPARTPWDVTRSAGGSSGGAAAAVAAGLAPLALGSDGGGSIRIPASVCGLVGFKPSRGRVSNGPIGGDLTGLVTHGPLARTVADAAAFLDAVAGPMPGDPWWAPTPEEAFLSRTQADPPRLRIGRFAAGILARPSMHQDCLAAYDAATALLVELGHEVVEVEPPAGPELADTFGAVWAALAAGGPLPPQSEDLLLPLTRWLRERGRAIPVTRFLTAAGELQGLARQTARAWASFDAVLSPTLAAPPVPVGSLRDDADPEKDFAAQMDFTPITSFYNLTGQPAVSLPLHVGGGGLPIGVMLAGRPAGDGDLFALAAQLERAAPWVHRRPALFQ
ncbi:MAG TPA: amidase [Sporichthya sp.]|nr:amidase [Sporichthya sp.]